MFSRQQQQWKYESRLRPSHDPSQTSDIVTALWRLISTQTHEVVRLTQHENGNIDFISGILIVHGPSMFKENLSDLMMLEVWANIFNELQKCERPISHHFIEILLIFHSSQQQRRGHNKRLKSYFQLLNWLWNWSRTWTKSIQLCHRTLVTLPFVPRTQQGRGSAIEF